VFELKLKKFTKGIKTMSEIKSYFDFYQYLVENLIKTNSNNVIWHLSVQTLEDTWHDDEEPWVDISLLVDSEYHNTRIYEGELTDEMIQHWDNVIQKALKSKSTKYNHDANIIHNAIKTIIVAGEDLDPELIEIRNELQQKGL